MLIMQTIRLRAIVKQEQLLSAIEAIDGSTYFEGLEYEHFFKLQAKYLSQYTNILDFLWWGSRTDRLYEKIVLSVSKYQRFFTVFIHNCGDELSTLCYHFIRDFKDTSKLKFAIAEYAKLLTTTVYK